MTKKWCIVPLCSNTSTKTPDKHFLSVPLNPKYRKQWLTAARRSVKDVSPKSHLYCCEDHFNLEEDFTNIIQVRLMGGHLKVKPGVVPHKFECQPDRSTQGRNSRVCSIGRASKSSVNALLVDSQDADLSCDQGPEIEDLNKLVQTESLLTADKCIQTDDILVRKVNQRSQGIQVNPRNFVALLTDIGCSPFSSPWTVTQHNFIPCPQELQSATRQLDLESEQTMESVQSSSTSYEEEDDSFVSSSFGTSLLSANEKQTFQLSSLQRTRELVQRCSRLYLGIPENRFSIIGLLAYKIAYKNVFLSAKDVVCLIFRKLRLNESFEILGNEFGISKQHASRVFRLYVSFVSDHIAELVIWPKVESVKKMLPISFRKNYNIVDCVIDCLEIEIEKPSDPSDQALTWSDYKSANTLKYLISITPDGLINFISHGYGGRTTDEMITSSSGFLDQLSKGTRVMADRGFKKIEPLLAANECLLIRPPSVSKGVKQSKAQTITARKIAGLRIHVERAIRRVREFHFLSPHACLDNKLIWYADEAIKIACGLVNLQDPLIK